MDAPERSRLERELFISLLRLAQADVGVERARASLSLLVRVTDAQRGYVELYPSGSTPEPDFSFSIGCNPDEETEIRHLTSRGIVAAAMATGEVVHTPSAALDERFRDRGSVRDRGLEAVLCVPLGVRPDGVLYLEGKPRGTPFSVDDVELTREVGLSMAPLLRAMANQEELRSLHDATRPYREKLRLEGVIGRSNALARVFSHVALAAPTDITVLITGASGTGKTQIAQAIHDNSPRRNARLVELNSAAIPEGLIESELFGTMPGAFPGAQRKDGKILEAAGGTLFLDEIGEVPFSAQAKLLQVLQSREFFPLGSQKPVRANVRLIAATNQDLATLVKQKEFREDLLFRLNVLQIRMPTLAERPEDIADLVVALLSRIAVELGVAPLQASPGLKAACVELELPGNVRQLRSRLSVALLRAHAEQASHVEAHHLQSDDDTTDQEAVTFQAATRRAQREFLIRQLNAGDWNVSEVAKRIDLTRAHVYNLIRELKITRPDTTRTGGK
ncbi:MAG TPA: sigma-54-dependent Fis family transcriptional regulator [Polyangia bacterium]